MTSETKGLRFKFLTPLKKVESVRRGLCKGMRQVGLVAFMRADHGDHFFTAAWAFDDHLYAALGSLFCPTVGTRQGTAVAHC